MANIRRAFDWIGRVFDIRGPGRSPSEIKDEYRATFDAFGSHRLPEVQNFIVNGPLGGTEITTTATPVGRWRFFLSMTAQHDDGVNQIMAFIRIVPTLGLFPQQAFSTDASVPGGIQIAARNAMVPPLGFIGVRSLAMGVAARLSVAGLFIEMDVGEYPRWGSEG